MHSPKKVTIGMPVRNGASTLERAIESVLSQTYENLEVILSDNASTDDTPAIARRMAARDPRIHYVRQPEPLTAWENFKFVLDEATGEYFLWAAHDDLRSNNYIETLVAALSSQPNALLAFTDVVRFHRGVAPTSGTSVSSPLCRVNVSSWAELVRDVLLSDCTEFYGVYNTRYLREYPWMDFDYGPDHLLLFYLRLRGSIVYAPGAIFYQSLRQTPATMRQRMEGGFYRKMGTFRLLRFSWFMGEVSTSASRQGAVPARRGWTVAYSYFVLRTAVLKGYVYRHVPRQAVKLWQRLKGQPMRYGDGETPTTHATFHSSGLSRGS